MERITEVLNWLFATRQGVVCLICGGIAVFLVIALVLERRTRRRYFNHQKSEDDWDLFDDDDASGWSDFDEDNH